MNNSQVFNFIDIYENKGDYIKHRSTTSVINFILSEDTITEQNSKVVTSLIDALSGDFAVLRNNAGIQIIMRVKAVEQQADKTELIVATGTDLIPLSHLFNVENDGYVRIIDIVGLLNYDITVFSEFGTANQPYQYSGDNYTVDMFSTKYGVYEHSYILRKMITNYGLIFKPRLIDGTFGAKIDIKVEAPNEITPIKININDKNLINDYLIKLSESEFNILMIYFEDEGNRLLYRLKENGEVHRFYYETEKYQPRRIKAGGVAEPIGSLSDENYTWWEGNIEPPKPTVDSIPIEIDEVTELFDLNATVIEADKLAYSLLREQYYNHEIELECNYINDKLDFTNLSDIFGYDIELTIGDRIINTRITKYEYNGNNNISLKLGNARTNLTDKLRMKGVL